MHRREVPDRSARLHAGVASDEEGPRPRHEQFLKFLATIDREVPAGLQIHLILDNYSTHKHANVKTWLAKHPT